MKMEVVDGSDFSGVKYSVEHLGRTMFVGP